MREEFRPKIRELEAQQKAEREVFANLEKTLFGKASNIVRTVRVSAQDIRDDKSGILSRSFRILSNAGEREAYFEKAQDRQRKALKKQRAERAKEAMAAVKAAHTAKLADERRVFEEERKELKKRHTEARKKLDADWDARTEARQKAFASFGKSEADRRGLSQEHRQSASPMDRAIDRAMQRYSGQKDFDEARQPPAREQNNEPTRDDDYER